MIYGNYLCPHCQQYVTGPHTCTSGAPVSWEWSSPRTSALAEVMAAHRASIAVLTAIQLVLLELAAGEDADYSRDFGRGVAYAARLITEALTATTDPTDSTDKEVG